MTINEFDNFQNQFFSELSSDNKKCLSTIENNKKLIEATLNNQDSELLDRFVEKFISVILDGKIKKFKLTENVLNHHLFNYVFAKFRNSDVLIRACKVYNKNAVEWLLDMGINQAHQDEKGMTALMYAAKSASLSFALKKIIKINGDCINLTDNNGNTALFYATDSPDNLKKLLKLNLDVTHMNNDGENVLLYAARYDKSRSFEILCKDPRFNPNQANAAGKTIAMYLVENGRFREVKSYVKEKKIDPNYRSKFGHSLVSVYVQRFYKQYIGLIGETNFNTKYNYVVTKNYALTLRELVELGCDFNVSVDEYGNTAVMVFLMIKDYVTTKYLLDNCRNINLSIRNNQGYSASYLCNFLDPEVFEKLKYNKIRNYFSISFKSLKEKLSSNVTFNPMAINNERGDNVPCYPIVPRYAETVEQWILEVLYPNSGAQISFLGNTYNKIDPNSFGSVAHKLNTSGLGTY